MKLFKPKDFKEVEDCSKEDIAKKANKLAIKSFKKLMLKAEGDWDFLIFLLEENND